MNEAYTGDLRELVSEPGAVLEAERPVYVYCPVHEDEYRPSLAVYSDHAFCYTCRTYLNRVQFSDHFSPAEQAWAKVLASRERTHKPRQVVDVVALAEAAHNLLIQQPDKLEWLEQRGIDLGTVKNFRLGHSGPAYTLPVVGSDGVETLRFRRDDAECPDGQSKYWGVAGKNDVAWFPFEPNPHVPTLVLTEGEFDALLLRRYGIVAFSLTNGAQAWKQVNWFDLLAAKRRVVLCGDQDAPGRASTNQLLLHITEMVETETISLHWDATFGKDITELWQRNPALFEEQIQAIRSLLGSSPV